jgi:pimeloyl-ACP methyl ester carboxylesterase
MQVEVNGHNINYILINKQLFDSEKPVLVFLHDGLGSIKQWKSIPQKICDAANLAGIIYDRIGYGLSSERKQKLNADYLHHEALIYLPELLFNLEIHNKVILIGHSDGATISLLFASFFPEKVSCLISEAAHVIVENITVEGIKDLRNKYHSNPALIKSLQKYHGDKTEKLFLDWTDLWQTNEIKEWNIKNELITINSPILAIQGVDDEFGSYKQLETIKKYASAEVDIQYIPDCKHLPHFEKENEVRILIKEFIKKNLEL